MFRGATRRVGWAARRVTGRRCCCVPRVPPPYRLDAVRLNRDLSTSASESSVRLTLYTESVPSCRWSVQHLSGSSLAVVRADGNPAPLYSSGTRIELSWQDADEHVVLELSGRVLGSDASGLRLQLIGTSEELLNRVRGYLANARPVERRAVARNDGSQDRFLDVIGHGIRGALAERCRRLLVHAEYGLDQVAHSEPFEVAGMPAKLAVQRLHAVQQSLEADFVQRVLRVCLGGGAQTEAARQRRGSALRLVDDDEMQVWLTRSESARALERETRASWHALLPALQAASDHRPELDMDLLGVEALLDALVHAAKLVGLEPSLQQLLLRLAGRVEILDLRNFYQQLLAELQRAGLRLAERPVAVAVAAPEWPRVQPVPSTVDGAPQQHTLALEAAPAAPATVQGRVLGEAKPPPPQVAIDTARRLWSLGQRAAPPMADESIPAVSDALLLQAVQSLATSLKPLGTPGSFREQLQAQADALLGAHAVRIDPRQAEAVELVGRLQQAIEVDPLLPRSFTDWSRRLLPTVLGAQLRPEGLGDSGERLRHLFALLEFGSVLCAERSDAPTQDIAQQIERVVNELARLPALLPEHIDDASQQLERLLQRHRKAGAAIEDRVVEACVGQQRLVDARNEVSQELALVFGGRDVPAAWVRLLDQRLHALLVLTMVRHGRASPEWQRVREHLDELELALSDVARGQRCADPDALLAWIPRLFTQSAADLSPLQEALDELAQALQTGGNDLWQRFVVAAPDPRVDSVVLTPDPLGDELSQRVALLQPGDWLAFGADGTEPRLLKLAWQAPDQQRFVFVSQLGHKAEDISGSALLAALREQRVRILDEGKASIVERAWRRMLEGLHDELAEQAVHDPLTGLLNRKELDRRLLRWINAHQRASLALLWVGLDHLRVLNDSHGMGAGDFALRQVGERLQELAGSVPSGYAARIAGDEFALVLPGTGQAEAEVMGRGLLSHLEALDLHWDERRFRINASVGLTVADESCASGESLLKDAERACRVAKESGRGRLYVHQADDFRISQMRESVNWVGRVEQSLEQGALVLFGQRAVSLSERAQQGPDYLEILLRMRTDDGYASPEHFIVAAERYGQITAIDRFVLQELTRALKRRGPSCPFLIAFNISARNIIDPAFIDEIVASLGEQPVPMSQLCIELTETAAIQQLADAAAGMKRLSAAGLSMVLDDFGSGWSSYQYLRRLPFDVVKVDGAFIRDIATSAEDLALARSINEVAHMLGKLTVAEHIENQETLDLVREIGFDYAQGFFMARPVPVAELLDPPVEPS